MPTYEYKCETCGYVFEKLQKMTDEPVKKCPKCKSLLVIGPKDKMVCSNKECKDKK